MYFKDVPERTDWHPSSALQMCGQLSSIVSEETKQRKVNTPGDAFRKYQNWERENQNQVTRIISLEKHKHYNAQRMQIPFVSYNHESTCRVHDEDQGWHT